jgi:hypothetical protein
VVQRRTKRTHPGAQARESPASMRTQLGRTSRKEPQIVFRPFARGRYRIGQSVSDTTVLGSFCKRLGDTTMLYLVRLLVFAIYVFRGWVLYLREWAVSACARQ